MTDGSGDPVVYLDSNVFIYFFDGDPARADAARSILFGPHARPGLFATSELTFAEVLAPSQQQGHPPQRRSEYFDLIAWNPTVRLYPITRDILLQTAELRRSIRLKLPDAIHCVTASKAGCRFLVSGDRAMSRLPEGMNWLDVEAKSAAALVNHFDA